MYNNNQHHFNNNNNNNNNSMYRIPNRIFVGGIPQIASQDELRDYFSHFGLVKDARIITDPRGNSKGYGFVTYESEADASKVLSLKEEDLVFKDSKLNIAHAFRKKNNFPMQQHHQVGHHHQSNNFGHHHQMNQFNGINNNLGSHHQINNHSMNSNFIDSPLTNMHQMQQNGMNAGFGQNHMNLSQMNGHLGMSALNGMSNFNHMTNLSGMSAIGGMNMN